MCGRAGCSTAEKRRVPAWADDNEGTFDDDLRFHTGDLIAVGGHRVGDHKGDHRIVAAGKTRVGGHRVGGHRRVLF